MAHTVELLRYLDRGLKPVAGIVRGRNHRVATSFTAPLQTRYWPRLTQLDYHPLLRRAQSPDSEKPSEGPTLRPSTCAAGT